MADTKKSISLRLASSTISELQNISKKNDVSQSQVVSILVQAYNSGADNDEIDTWLEIAKRN